MAKTIAIIGLGYVGLPLAIEFGKHYPTLGFDIDHRRILELQSHIDKTHQIIEQDFKDSHHLSFHSDLENLKDAQIYIITVPTPLDQFKNPDISYLQNASKSIAPLLKQGDIVIYESTTYPTCTRLDCIPILEQYSHLKFNIDFFVGYSPERVSPNDHAHKLTQIQKITSGSTQESAQEIDTLYSSIITAGTYLAPSIEIAEMAKAIENAQRDLNIAFVNEVAILCDALKIPTHEVLKAASTKWNFLPFSPGLVGGHCISVDPYYLTHKAQELGIHTRVISAGRLVNDAMPHFIAHKLIKLISQAHIPLFDARILILGATFKENCNDIRNSKIFEVAQELQEFGCKVTLLDPLADKDEVQSKHNLTLFHTLEELPRISFDALLGAVAHDAFTPMDFTPFLHQNSVIYDLKGMLKSSHARL
ncbi:nucleotide sugar dehydrogenase [Helicobacter kayseriensis]|uniref:nucleotide sugar dehydrogenase n=1 Tax=Helicobacter kayseriensis TaxID=2905877 RepID=UPI001E38303E|nr:nucleotide sugar dehydrogenase [Helicobacter kayseriensis]MCE3046643.1 nucleotide sugar dehydrogenase [Helicobacter kayseriensis]MCE3048055.1 nucleotide sugar dehydrogenase [Helicobacter kayseriensis]